MEIERKQQDRSISSEDRDYMPCHWRFEGVCLHPHSKWYNSRVVDDKKWRCNTCADYEG